MAAPYQPPPGAAALSPLAKSLAMPADVVRRLAADSLRHARPGQATILQFADYMPAAAPAASPRGSLEQVARLYLAHPAPPNGYAKQLADEHGVNYGSLLTKIGLLRTRCL